MDQTTAIANVIRYHESYLEAEADFQAHKDIDHFGVRAHEAEAGLQLRNRQIYFAVAHYSVPKTEIARVTDLTVADVATIVSTDPLRAP